MKKMLAILCCAAIAVSCMLLAGCGGSGTADLSDSEYVGTWVAQTIDAFGKEETTEDVNEAIEGGMSMTLNDDGTLVADFGEGEPINATWTETSDGFKTKGDIKLTFKAEDGGVTTNIVGANIHFVKQ